MRAFVRWIGVFVLSSSLATDVSAQKVALTVYGSAAEVIGAAVEDLTKQGFIVAFNQVGSGAAKLFLCRSGGADAIAVTSEMTAKEIAACSTPTQGETVEKGPVKVYFYWPTATTKAAEIEKFVSAVKRQ